MRYPESGYYNFVKRIGQPEQDAELAKRIETCQNKTDKTYGYRRVWKWLKGRNIEKNPKTVLRVMKKYGLLSEIRRRRKWINLGQQVHKYENLMKRQFRADCQSCIGHNLAGNEEREKESRCGIAAPQRPGFQYTSTAYFKLTQSYGIIPSMSSKGTPYDNAMAENFFSILKTACIYRHKPKAFKETHDLIDRYIHFYNHERIQNKTGVAPLTLRHSA